MQTIRNFIVTEEGGLTGAGYAVFIAAAAAALLIGAYLAGRRFRSEVHGRDGGVKILIFESE